MVDKRAKCPIKEGLIFCLIVVGCVNYVNWFVVTFKRFDLISISMGARDGT